MVMLDTCHRHTVVSGRARISKLESHTDILQQSQLLVTVHKTRA